MVSFYFRILKLLVTPCSSDICSIAAHETAHYVAHCLSHGINPNPDSKTGITKLPPLVIQDITEWIKQGRVTGKGFLMGGEGSWA
jgi:hypothetical protein